jgi:hypothetical protein
MEHVWDQNRAQNDAAPQQNESIAIALEKEKEQEPEPN